MCRPIAVVGASGAVGRAAIAQLVRWGVGPLRLGARDVARCPPDDEVPGSEAVAVDIDNAASLREFCAGSLVVVNCAGPALVIGDRVARAALAAGAAYVDAAGDDTLYAQLAGAPTGGVPVLLSAGLMPGLTGLLPRYLARPGARRLVGYVGGRDRFTATAALDYLAAGDGYGEPLAAWRNGVRVSRALGVHQAVPPGFDETVTLQPYLSTETERLAVAVGLSDVDWYSAFAGDRVLAVLRQPSTDQAARLCRAAELDLFGVTPYQLIVLDLDGTTLVLRGTGASALTGAAAAAATVAVWRDEVPAGLHHAAEILDPATAVNRLRDCAAVVDLRVLTEVDCEEEGVL